MAITLRLNDEQEEKLQKLMEWTGESTKSKTLIHMIENGEELLNKKHQYSDAKREIKTLFDTLDELRTHID